MEDLLGVWPSAGGRGGGRVSKEQLPSSYHHIQDSTQYQFSISSLSWAIVGERDDGLELFVRIGNSSTVVRDGRRWDFRAIFGRRRF